MVLGSGIRDPEKTYSGSRIQGSKSTRSRIPDPQHCRVRYFLRHVPMDFLGVLIGVGEVHTEKYRELMCEQPRREPTILRSSVPDPKLFLMDPAPRVSNP
jgi:hypothetical protein